MLMPSVNPMGLGIRTLFYMKMRHSTQSGIGSYLILPFYHKVTKETCRILDLKESCLAKK